MMRGRRLAVAVGVGVLGGPFSAGAQARPAAAPRITSFELIDQALAAHRIDAETALKYRVFVAFGDSRLPAAYRGAVYRGDPTVDIAKAAELVRTGSAATRAEMAPFFMRPDEPGSWITLGTVGDLDVAPASRRPPGRGLGLFSRPSERRASFSRFSTPGSVPVGGGSEGPADEQAAPITWKKFTAVGGKAKVWAQDRYPGDAAKAEALANKLDSDRIWTRLTGLMQREPASDANLTPNGGDGALDIYLVHAPIAVDPETGTRGPAWAGVARSAVPANICHRSRYLLIDSNLPLVGNRNTNGILSTAAHELFHAITYTYDVVESCAIRWVREGTATWAENWIYPAPNSEHDLARAYMLRAQLPIDNGQQMYPDYGTYVLPLYREKTSNPDFMRTMWENFERLTAATPPLSPTATLAQQSARRDAERLRTLKGVNDALKGGFDETWPLFLNRLWNQSPVDTPNGYKGWDQLTETPFPWGARQRIETPAGPVTTPITLPVGLDGGSRPSIMPVAGVFTQFEFKPNVRSVVFVNSIADIAHPHKSVWGIQKIRGRWKDPEDWTDDFQKVWCRDDAREDLEELVIIFGNSDSERLEPVTPEKLPEIKASPTGCTAWVGTSTARNTLVSTDPALTIVETADATLRFEFDSAANVAGQPREYWLAASGQISWSANVTGRCTGSASGVQAIVRRPLGEEMANLRVWDDNGTVRHSGTVGSWPGDIPTVTINCPNRPPFKQPVTIALGWFTTDMKSDEVLENGKLLSRTYTSSPAPGSGITNKMSYSLRLSP